MNKNRIIHFIMAFMMLTTLLPTQFTVIVDAATITPKEVVLADFSGGSIPDDVTVVNRNETTNTASRIDTSVGYDGGSSLAYTFDTKSTHIKMPYDSEVYSKYDTFKVRVYSEIAGQKINFLINEENTASSGSDKGCYNQVMETTGEWQVYSIPVSQLQKKWASTPVNLYVLLNCSGWNIYPGTEAQLGTTFIKSNQNYTYASIKGETFHIDRIWLENSSFGGKMEAPEPSVANGEGWVSPDIDGNNTFSIRFPSGLWEDDYSGAVRVYEIIEGEDVDTSAAYTVETNGDYLDVVFETELSVGDYKIVLDASAILGASGETLEADVSYVFSVGKGSVFFEIVSTSVEDGADDVDASMEGFEYTAEFNNEINTDNIEQKILFAKNGEEYTDYTVSCDTNVLSLVFNSPLEGNTDYSLTIDKTLCDIYGNTLSDSKIFTFKTIKDPSRIRQDGIIFDADSANDREDALVSESDRISEAFESENVFDGNYAYKLTYPKNGGTEFVSLKHGDISEWRYVNYLIYNPSATEDYMRFIIDAADVTDSGDSYFAVRVPLDWEGWKLFCIPVSDYEVSRSADFKKIIGHKINFGGWGDAMSDGGYILIDRIWLSDMPSDTLGLLSTEYANEQEYVDEGLGGDNAYAFTFDSSLIDMEYSEDVNVYEKASDGKYYPTQSDYFAIADGNNLKVEFADKLTKGITYKITLDKLSIVSNDYRFNGDEVETVFTVGSAAPYFYVTDVSVEDGAENVRPGVYEIEFNHEPENCELTDYISVFADGVKQYNAFTCRKDGKKIVLTFTSELIAGANYTVAVADGYSDIFGNVISGTQKFGFTTPEVYEKATVATFFTASDDEKFDAVVASSTLFEEETDNVNLYNRSVRLNYTAGVDKSSYPYRGADVDVSNMKYINFWLYSSGASDTEMVFVAYTDRDSNKGTNYKIMLDWEGWKLVSIAKSNLGNYNVIDAINFNFGGWSTIVEKSGYVLFDEIWASCEAPSPIALKSSSIPDGYTGAAISGETLTLELSDIINTKITPNVTVTDGNGREVSDYQVNMDANRMNFVFGKLEPLTEYTVCVSGLAGTQPVPQTEPIVVGFTTESENIYLENIDFGEYSFDGDKTTTAKYTVSNLSQNEYTLDAIAYVMDVDNRLISLYKKSFVAAAGSESVEETEVTLPKGSVKVIAYVSTSDGTILSDRYYVIDATGAQMIIGSDTGGESVSLKIEKAELNVNVVEIKGKLSGISDIVKIGVSGSEVMAEMLMKADYDGTFTAYYVFPSDAASGEYIISAESKGIKDTFVIQYVSGEHRALMLNLANGSSPEAFADFIAEYGEALGLKELSDEQAEDIAAIVTDKADFESYAEVVEFMASIDKMITDINTAKWNDIRNIIAKNTEILDANDKNIRYFLSLSEKKQNQICEILFDDLPVSTVGEFKKLLDNSIEEYEDSAEPPRGSSSGGGGGGGSKPVSSVNYPAGSALPDSYTPIEANSVFTDLDSAEWSRDYVMTLYESGVISPAADGKFRPNDSITREEFVKMLVCAFVPENVASTHRFSDEAEGAWYNTYLSKAYASGITTGYPDGSFGIGANITREDMVTLCARTLEALGANLNGTAVPQFADAHTIADYAFGYVASMTQLGIINGMGNGMFAPKNTATRAEAAKVIAGLAELY